MDAIFAFGYPDWHTAAMNRCHGNAERAATGPDWRHPREIGEEWVGIPAALSPRRAMIE
jgi:hypothetical protein